MQFPFPSYSAPTKKPAQSGLSQFSRQGSQTVTLRRLERANPIQILFELSPRLPQVHSALGVEPEFGAVAEQPGKPERHGRGECPPLAQQFVDSLARHAERLGERGDGQPVIRHEIFSKHGAGMGGRELAFSFVPDAHSLPRCSMIVGDFHVICVAVFPAKAYPPLVIDGYGMLASTISL